MPEQEVLAAFQEELGGETAATPEVKTETPATVEELEYFLGDKANKLPSTAEFAVKHNGQIVRAPLDKLVTAYRERSHLDDKFKKFNTERQEFDARAKEFGDVEQTKADLADLQALNDWSLELQKTNPNAYNHLMGTIEQIKTGTWGEGQENTVNTALLKEIDGLKSQVTDLGKFKTDFEEQQEQKLNKEALSETQMKAKEFQELFPEIKLDEKDQDGVTLESRIINQGAELGFEDFTSAAKVILHDQIAEALLQRGRNEVVKGIKGDHKAGIVGRTSTPQVGQGQVDVSKLGEEEKRDAALAEYEQLLTSEQQQ